MSEENGTDNQQNLSTIAKKRGFTDSVSESDKFSDIVYEGEYNVEIPIPQYIGIGSWCSSTVSKSEEFQEAPLSSIEASSVVCVLQDAIDELIILKYVIGAPLISYNLNYRSLKERYTRRLTPVRIYPEVESTPIFTSPIKLQRDRASVEAIFSKLTKALLDNGSFSPLTNYLKTLRSEEEDDQLLVEELKNNILLVKDLKRKLEEKRKVDELEEKEREELMYQLQDELDGVALKCEVEEKFINKWENVRNAQNQQKLKIAENSLRDNITKFRTKMNMETRVTYEIQAYLKVCQTELEEKLEEWMAKYDTETERRETRLAQLKYSRDQEEEKKYLLHQLYEQRSNEMKKWGHFREIRKIKVQASLTIQVKTSLVTHPPFNKVDSMHFRFNLEKIFNKPNTSVVNQSWWRGIIVRKKLSLKKGKKNKKRGTGGRKKRA